MRRVESTRMFDPHITDDEVLSTVLFMRPKVDEIHLPRQRHALSPLRGLSPGRNRLTVRSSPLVLLFVRS